MTAIDNSVLTQLAADLSVADLRLVLQTFETDMQRLVASLAAAGQAGDAAGWQRAAHSIAGAAAAVGASEVERQARQAMTHFTFGHTSAAVVVAMNLAVAAALTELQHFTMPGSPGG
jgi:chemotaxis protein histidine kinase CheA